MQKNKGEYDKRKTFEESSILNCITSFLESQKYC